MTETNRSQSAPPEIRPRRQLRLLMPLGERQFALLFVGQTVSRLGNAAYVTVLAWTAYAITNSTAATGSVLTASSVPLLILLLAGGLIGDRFSRRLVILTSDTLSGLAVGLVALLAALGDLTFGSLLALAATFGITSAFFAPAYQALIPDIVPEERLQSANALQMLSSSSSQVIGPAIGAALYSWGRAAAAFGFDAVTFFISAIATLFIHVPARPLPARLSIWQDVRSGWDYLRRTTWLWSGIAIATILNAAGNAPYFVLLPAVIKHLHLGVGTMGLTLSITGVAAVLTNMVVGQLPKLPRRGIIVFAMWSLIGVTTILVGVAPAYWLIAVAAALKGATYAADTVWYGLVQDWVPREYLSRISSLDMLGSFALMPLGYAASGLIAAVIGINETLVVGGAIALALSLIGPVLPAVRRLA